jgi:hypothetical protein
MPTKADDIVIFLLPDGTEVSNDPRWAQKMMEDQIREQMLGEHTGVATQDDGTMRQRSLAPPQSGQPGVGAAAVGAGPREGTGAELQPGEDGYVHPEQSRAATHTGQDGAVSPFDSGEDEGEVDDEGEDQPYTEWTKKELAQEVKARRKLGRDIDLSAGKTKADVIAALEADDEAAQNEQ